MTQWNEKDAVAATGGKATGAFAATGVSIDTRTLGTGELFVALRGENMDGHAYLAGAREKGAAAAVVDHEVKDAGLPLIIVEDTHRALEGLGKAARERFKGTVLGLTGSVGKTGTKEMLKIAFSAFGETFATRGNLNNHYGVPLMLANLPPQAKFGIFEMGMNHAGEIRALTKQVRPHVGVITTVAPVHLEFFESEAGIADAKAEIAEGIMEGGAIVLPFDNPHVARLKAAAQACGVTRIYGFSEKSQASAQLLSCKGEGGGLVVEAVIEGETLRYRLSASGTQWAMNSLAVLLAVKAAGLDVKKAATALAAFSEPDGRGRVERLAWKGGDIQLIDDSYNASPPSIRAAMITAARLHAENGMSGRVHAALGDMKELGRDAPKLHAALAEDALNAGVDVVHTVGKDMAALREALPSARRGAHAEDSGRLAEKMLGLLGPGDTLLVKGSHSMKMEKVAEAVRAANGKGRKAG
ncbi:MAG: UDP-N-acetylmuramoyl-tripeptide--D-alanyl-D-alanine ligase [Alphaproteobacteria bacterium]|nr:UDP-N-acetylmuramoyl-tripeptide--D-alanyl-D-alanine ligase [Alphaproteobacteria bacterium]